MSQYLSSTSDTSPAVIVISSHVVRGSVGNRAAIFALESLGFPVWALQTITLPWHPGHRAGHRGAGHRAGHGTYDRPSTRILPENNQFASIIEDLCHAPWLSEVGAILTGYLGDASQAKTIAKLVKKVKQKTPDALYICDPVIGDFDRLYVPEQTAYAIKKYLVPLSDIATPNRYELAWLTTQKIKNNNEIIKAALTLGPDKVLTTSAFSANHGAFSKEPGSIANLLSMPTRSFLAEHRSFERSVNGAGDLTAALFLARILAGMNDEKSLQWVTSRVFEILEKTITLGKNELVLEQDISSLIHPQTMVKTRILTWENNDDEKR